MKYLIKIALISVTIFSSIAYATEDYGKIEKIYITQSGSIALKLFDGFPNADAASECPTNIGWAGNLNADPSMIASLLSAKASSTNVSLVITGCDNNDKWFKITAVYIRQP